MTDDHIFLEYDGAFLGDRFLALGEKIFSPLLTVFTCENDRPCSCRELYVGGKRSVADWNG